MESSENKYIAVILYPACIEYETMLAAEVCNQKIPVRVFTPTGEGHRGSSGFQIKPDGKVEDINPDHCRGLLVPGGDPYELIEGPAAKPVAALLVELHERKIPIGAICAGPAVLGKAGILKGKKFTHGYGDTHKEFLAPLWNEAEFTDSAVEVDGNLVTAKPDAHIAFGTHFAKMVGVIESEEQRWKLTRYYGNRTKAESSWLDHATFAVADLARSKSFYDKVFSALEIPLAFGEEKIFWAYELGTGLFEFRQQRDGEQLGRYHIAIAVSDKEKVHTFHKAALEAGGTCNGEPGPRPEYTPNYYAAFIRDPDGHNIEVMMDQ